MKRILQFLLAAGLILSFALIFYNLSPVVYKMQGTVGSRDFVSILSSVLYCVAFVASGMWCGFKRYRTAICGVGLSITLILVIGGLGITGYGVLLGEFSTIFYVLAAPFTPIVENLIQNASLYRVADIMMLLVPALIYAVAMGGYALGSRLARRPQTFSFIDRRESRLLIPVTSADTASSAT